MATRLYKAYEVKHSVRYNAVPAAVGGDEEPEADSVYLKKEPLKKRFGGFPETLVLRIDTE
jgi:hypothetical protein